MHELNWAGNVFRILLNFSYMKSTTSLIWVEGLLLPMPNQNTIYSIHSNVGGADGVIRAVNTSIDKMHVIFIRAVEEPKEKNA